MNYLKELQNISVKREVFFVILVVMYYDIMININIGSKLVKTLEK